MEFPRVFITGWECRECPRKLKHLSFFFMKKKMMQARRCVLCVVVLCVGGVIKGPMPPAPCPCPQPHAPNPMPSRGEQGEPIRMASNTSPSPFKPPAPCLMPPSPMPLEESKQLQVSMPARLTLSQCPHAPSPRIQWGWGQLARIQTCAPQPPCPQPQGAWAKSICMDSPHAQC